MIWPDRQNAPGPSMLRRGQGLNASCRASERDPIALVESCQRSLLWLSADIENWTSFR